jgi:signal transduction histidine kinase
MSPAAPKQRPWLEHWQGLYSTVLRAFHRYANWLVGISWRRFAVLSLLLVILANLLQEVPPFSWRVTETIEGSEVQPPKPPRAPEAPKAAKAPKEPVIRIEKSLPGASSPTGIDITIDERGIRITPKNASAAASAASAASGVATGKPAVPRIAINLPENASSEEVRDAIRGAVEEARDAIQDAVQAQREAIADARAARQEAEEAAREAARAAQDAVGLHGPVQRTRRIHIGDFLNDLAVIWVLGSAIIKITYKGRMQAEVKAAQATETAEAESLKRQVVEARMAAMQAQVEPHFLFNTLASIDHLIETDPPRASQMQKNLIALLRASMPTMRETGDGAPRDLGRELAVIRPYLEILKVRMEERLSTSIDVPDGLLSAEFPSMMIQTLVENAIKHGLEPKAEGGSLAVRAEIVHGKLAVTVADTGLGFGKAATAGTGVGLANIRERLQLLYGHRASLTVAENPGGGTLVTVTVPYKSIEGASA